MYLFNCTTYHRYFMSYGWIVICLISVQSTQPFHLILDPAGDAKMPGRQLTTCTERSVTLQFCEMLKKTIVDQIPQCTVTITRTAGETRTQEQRAQIANQLQADLFIHISCFNDDLLRPQLAFYYTASSVTHSVSSPYTLIPVHKSFDFVAKQTNHRVHTLYLSLNGTIPYTVQAPCAIPDARLVGLMIPACTLECGITHDVPWTALIEPLANAIIDCMGD